MNIFRDLSRAILHFFFAHTVGTLFVLLVIEEAGIPIPIAGDYLIAIAGGQRHKPFGYPFLIIGISSIAVILGSSLLFLFVRQNGRPLLDRYGKYILLDQAKVQKLERWFERYGRTALIVGRLIPGLRIPTTVMAGLSAISYREYLLFAGIAAVIWSSAYFFLGTLVGREWRRILGTVTGILDNIPRGILLLSLIAVGVAIIWQNRKRLGRMVAKTLNLVKVKRP